MIVRTSTSARVEVRRMEGEGHRGCITCRGTAKLFVFWRCWSIQLLQGLHGVAPRRARHKTHAHQLVGTYCFRSRSSSTPHLLHPSPGTAVRRT
jgi:hypothetical protein